MSYAIVIDGDLYDSRCGTTRRMLRQCVPNEPFGTERHRADATQAFAPTSQTAMDLPR